MGEIKSVKVDNWGVFFLQKLQNFFNKTDYCDLTLQFRDNSQLKVHRLVLSACTDFFNVLEQTCELMDDALVMPMELQADVVVPIVNFMYTGTLEFELKMYNKLLKTAKEMNMTVLLKLLEAHKRTMEGSRQIGAKPGSPKNKGKRTITNSASVAKLLSSPSTISSTQQTQRRTLIPGTPTTTMRRVIAGKPMPGSSVFRQVSTSLLKTSPKMQRGPTRYETVDPNLHTETYESSFDAISYESKPLKEEPEEYEEMQATPTKSRSSPFEQLRKGYNNNKRPAVSTFTSPPAKKPNIEDVKEFSEQQRMRKQIAAEYGDDAEYDGIMDDEFHNDDDDDEPSAAGGPSSSSSAAKQQQQQQHQAVQPQASIIIKQSPNEKPTIVVKDSTNSKMDHAKIISEVLRQYPHLVKSNKNIKLKIMPNIGGQSQKIVVKKETIDSMSAEMEQNKITGGALQARQQLLQLSQKPQTILRPSTSKTGLSPVSSTKIEAQSTAVPVTDAASTTTNTVSAPPQKRRIDSKTMHALIALGAENTTGPWLCLRCGVNGRPISIPSYRGFRRHLINTHKETIDSALCEHCGWRSTNNRTLNHHILVEHKISSPLYVFPKCEHCAKICLDPNDLESHIAQVHPESHKQQCIYCNKVFSKEMLLYTHMKTFHKKRAREDGVIDFSDDELNDFDDEIKDLEPESTVDKKIKIISDISLPSTILKLDEVPASIEEDYANDSGPKFVNADGNEMLLTAEQREEIMSQLEQDHEGGVVMVLNESAFPPGESVVVGDESKLETGEHVEEYDDHNIYSEFPTEGETAFVGNDISAEESALDVSKGEEEETNEHQESDRDERMDEDDHMEWAENVISAHDANDDEEDEDTDEDEEDDVDAKEKPVKAGSTKKYEEKVSSLKSSPDSIKPEKKDPKKEEDINLKLKMLTGDWSDDEIDDDEVEDEPPTVAESEKEKTNENPTGSTDNDAVAKSTEGTEKKQEKETPDDEDDDDEEEEEEESEPAPPAAAVAEEISQSSQLEKAEENDFKIKEEPIEEKLPEEDFPIKLENTVSETIPLDTAVEKEEKEKPSSSSKVTKPRRKSAKDVVKQTTEAEKSLDDFIAEDPLNVKITSPKKTEEDSLAAVETEDKKESTEIKSDTSADKEESVTSTKSLEDSQKTVDKVKNLISEWGEDEDDI